MLLWLNEFAAYKTRIKVGPENDSDGLNHPIFRGHTPPWPWSATLVFRCHFLCARFVEKGPSWTGPFSMLRTHLPAVSTSPCAPWAQRPMVLRQARLVTHPDACLEYICIGVVGRSLTWLLAISCVPSSRDRRSPTGSGTTQYTFLFEWFARYLLCPSVSSAVSIAYLGGWWLAWVFSRTAETTVTVPWWRSDCRTFARLNLKWG